MAAGPRSRYAAHMHARAVCLFLGWSVWLAACAPAAPAPARPRQFESAPAVTGMAVYPDDDVGRFIGLVADAERRVWLKAYLLTDIRLIDALKTARERGADVRVILEDDVYGSDDRIRDTERRLIAAGVPVKLAGASFRLSHEKSAVIDDRAVIMTANLTPSAWTRNREIAVEVGDPRLVAGVAACFAADWSRGPCAHAGDGLVWSPGGARDALLALIGSARATLDVYTEVMQDRDTVDAMARQAGAGVRVRVIMSPETGGDGATSGPALDALQRAGVRVRLLAKPYVHAKALIVDRARAYVGSHNLSFSSLDLNRELGIVFDASGAIGRLTGVFDADWAAGIDR